MVTTGNTGSMHEKNGQDSYVGIHSGAGANGPSSPPGSNAVGHNQVDRLTPGGINTRETEGPNRRAPAPGGPPGDTARA